MGSELIEKFHIMDLSQGGKLPSLKRQASWSMGETDGGIIIQEALPSPEASPEGVCVCVGMGV